MGRTKSGIKKLEYDTAGGTSYTEASNMAVQESQLEFPDMDNDDTDPYGGRYPGAQMRTYTLRFLDPTAGQAIKDAWENLKRIGFQVTMAEGETHAFVARPQQVQPDDVPGAPNEGRVDGWMVVINVLDREVTESGGV